MNVDHAESVLRPRFILMPPRILWLLLACAGLAHWALGEYNPTLPSCPALGVGLIALSIGINVWASRLFERARTPICPNQTPTAIVEEGPFRWSRNPMYLGLITLSVGTAMATGSAPFWVVALAYGAILRLVFIPHEERVLRAQFGPAFERYAARVGRWLGRQEPR